MREITRNHAMVEFTKGSHISGNNDSFYFEPKDKTGDRIKFVFESEEQKDRYFRLLLNIMAVNKVSPIIVTTLLDKALIKIGTSELTLENLDSMQIENKQYDLRIYRKEVEMYYKINGETERVSKDDFNFIDFLKNF